MVPLNLVRVIAIVAQATLAQLQLALAQAAHHQAVVVAAHTAHCHNGQFGSKAVSHLTSI